MFEKTPSSISYFTGIKNIFVFANDVNFLSG